MAKYTTLTESRLRDALALFDIDYQESAHIDGGAANSSYHVIARNADEFVLTVLDNTINLPAETLARLLKYLSDSDVPTGEPVAGRDGALIETFEGHRLMLKRYVQGNCYTFMPLEHIHSAGAALARVHLPSAPAWLPSGTRRLPEIDNTLASFNDKDFAQWVLRNMNETRSLFDLPVATCVVHGDYFPDNLIVRLDGSVAVLDWETASVDFAILDIGIAIVGFACTDGQLDVERLQTFLGGYRSVRMLEDGESAQLQNAVIFGATILGYHRYLRHHIRYPDPTKYDLYREMQRFDISVKSLWPKEL